MKLTISLSFTVLFVFFTCLDLSAQETELPMVALPVISVSGTMVQTFAIDNGQVQQVFSSPAYYSFGGGGGGLNSLHDPSVMRDLELVDSQMAEIAEIRAEYSKLIQSNWKKLSNSKNNKQGKKEIQTRVAELQAEQKQALSDVLLPHQLDRIKQVNHQMQMQAMGGAVGALQYGSVAKELDITAEQKKKLAEIQKEMNEEIAAKTAKIRAAAKKKVFAELTSEQKEKLKELTGEEFKRNSKDWQEQRERMAKKRDGK